RASHLVLGHLLALLLQEEALLLFVYHRSAAADSAPELLRDGAALLGRKSLQDLQTSVGDRPRALSGGRINSDKKSHRESSEEARDTLHPGHYKPLSSSVRHCASADAPP